MFSKKKPNLPTGRDAVLTFIADATTLKKKKLDSSALSELRSEVMVGL